MMPQMNCRCSQKVYPPFTVMDHAVKIWRCFWMALICSTLVIGCLPRIGCTEGVGRIRGVIQREGKGFAEQRIMLIRFGPNQDVQRFPGQTDAEGRFFFENLETGPAFTYFVGIRYNEQLHRSDPVILQSEEPAEVVLEVSEQPAQEAKGSDASPPLRIINHLMVIVGRGTHLEVREVVKLANTGTTPYIEKAGHGGASGISLHLPLPQGHYNFGQVQGLNTEYVRVDTVGLSYLAPLPPGEHQIVYTYNLPWHDGLATILVERLAHRGDGVCRQLLGQRRDLRLGASDLLVDDADRVVDLGDLGGALALVVTTNAASSICRVAARWSLWPHHGYYAFGSVNSFARCLARSSTPRAQGDRCPTAHPKIGC